MLLMLFVLLVSASCGDVGEPGGPGSGESRELRELERMSFVPADPGYELLGGSLLPDGDLSLMRAIVIDRFEFTRADLRYYWPERMCRADTLEWQAPEAVDMPERSEWPAFMSFYEAEELAHLRGMRLPTPIEWLHVAVGRRDYRKPWGGAGREFFANTLVLQNGVDFSLNMPCNVGTYENGRSSPFGCYDLLGNVWEWVDGVVLGCFDGGGSEERLAAEASDDGGAKASLMGGAYNSAWRPTFELDKKINRLRYHARKESKNDLGPSFGARMCADAEPYLWEKASRWGSGARVRGRVRAVGARWGRSRAMARSSLRSLLAELRARPGAPEALAWLEEGVLAEE